MNNTIETPRNCTYNENKAEIDGDNYTITFDHDDGTIEVWSRGAMVSSFRNLSIYDYFLRFYPSIHEAYQEFSREIIEKHLDTYKDHVKLHRFKGDHYRFETTADDTRYFEEDIMTRGTLQDELTSEQLEDLREKVGMELIYDADTTEILNDTLEKLEERMHNTLENYGLEDMIEEYTMRELHELFMEKKSEKLAEVANSIELKPLIDEVKK